jgi:hypothetical protein
MGRLRALLCLVLLSSCGLHTTEVQLSQEQKDNYWSQLSRRIPAWFREVQVVAPSALPEPHEVYSRVRIVEFPSTPGSTCYFDPPSRIEIGDDKWLTDCVAHELGHATLYFAGHPCWGEFEHQDEVEKCRARF